MPVMLKAKSSGVNQMKGGPAIKGVVAMNDGKKTRSEMPANKRRSGGSEGEMYKKPGKTGRGMASARSDQSSSETGPLPCNYKPVNQAVPQPTQYSNDAGPRKTKFVW